MEIIPNGSNDVNQGIEGQCTTKQQVDDPVGLYLEKINISGLNKFDSYENAGTHAYGEGIVILKSEFLDQDLLTAFRLVGCDVRWNELFMQLEVFDEDKSDQGWTLVSAEGHELRRVLNKVANRCAVINRQGRGKNAPYAVERLNHARAWGKRGKDLIAAFLALRGDKIADVHPRAEFAAKMEEKALALPPERKVECKRKVQRFFVDTPYLKPKTEDHAICASAAGRVVFATLGHRFLQIHPKYANRRPRGQTSVPVIVGKAGTGKSSFMNALNHKTLPQGGSMPVGAFEMPWIELQRMISTANFVLMDDIETVQGREGKKQVAVIKRIVTAIFLTIRRMYANDYDTKINPCVLLGTANSVQLPPEDGMRRRFLPWEWIPRANWKGGEEAVKALHAYVDANIEDCILGGFLLAIEDAQLELTEEESAARDRVYAGVSKDEHGMIDCIKEMFRSGNYRNDEGQTRMGDFQIVQRYGALRTKENKPIPIDDRSMSTEELLAAWKAMDVRAANQLRKIVREAMHQIGVTDYGQSRGMGEQERHGIIEPLLRVWRFPPGWCTPEEEFEGTNEDTYRGYESAKSGNANRPEVVPGNGSWSDYTRNNDVDFEGEYTYD